MRHADLLSEVVDQAMECEILAGEFSDKIATTMHGPLVGRLNELARNLRILCEQPTGKKLERILHEDCERAARREAAKEMSAKTF